MNRALAGAIAGAVGSTVIDAVSNLDMVVRARPASQVPQRTVEPIAEAAGLVASGEPGGDGRAGARSNRLSGLGALGGSLTGVGAGLVYALVRPRLRAVPLPLAGLALGAGVMAATDTSATVAGATDPRSWSVASWAADVVPHAVYGLATAAVADLLVSAGTNGAPTEDLGRERAP